MRKLNARRLLERGLTFYQDGREAPVVFPGKAGRSMAAGLSSAIGGSTFRDESGQGALLNFQDVLFSTMAQVAMRMPFDPFRQMDSPIP